MAEQKKVWTREELIELINTNNLAVERAILRIHAGQTAQEKQDENTYDHNDIGFSSAHAKVGTYMAKWLQQGKHLTGDWLPKGRKIALRHVRQLLKVANAHAAQ